MDYWDFLLQKEGDRSWLPLESPDVEILEGRYRVVARSSRASTPIEIRVSHTCEAENPPKRRVQVRSGQTNPDGLLVVMPFTRLQPGVWELRCRGDLMSDLLGESWQTSVHLQVFSQEAEADEWSSDWQESPLAETHSDQPSQIEVTEPQEAVVPVQGLTADRSEQRLEQDNLTTDQPLVSVSPPLSDAIGSVQVGNAQADVVQINTVQADAVQQEAETVPESDTASSDATEAVPLEPLFAAMAPIVRVDEATHHDAETVIREILAASSTPLSQLAEELSDQLIQSVFQELELDQAADPGLRIPSSQQGADAVDRPDQSIAPHSPLQLTLEHNTYVVQRGQALELRGQVESLDQNEVTLAGELNISLRDPQQSSILVEMQQPLPQQSLPLSFSCTVTIPANYETHVLLGELTLRTADAIAATHAFAITIDLDELLESIADETSSDAIQPPLEFAGDPANDLNLSFLNLLVTPTPPLQLQPSLQQPLPPQLYQPDPNRPKSKSLQLPFMSRSPQAVNPSIDGDTPQVEPTAERMAETVAPGIGTAETAVALPETVLPAEAFQPSASTALEADSPIDLPLEWQTASTLMRLGASGADQIDRPATPEDNAFRSLNLKQRFWSRLNSLAGDAELSNWLQSASPNSSQGSTQVSSLDADLAAQEIVVEEEVLMPPKRGTTQAEPPASLVLPKDAAVPTPQIEVPSGELTAGKSVNVRVKMPNLTSRIYVKLWLHDRQTRSLLDGPRWLVNFIPNGLGALEAHLSLTVPFGCLEVQFEAIAVEMATQRESHKTTLDRLVVPPDFPVLSLEELDV